MDRTPAAESARMPQWRPGWPKPRNLRHAWTGHQQQNLRGCRSGARDGPSRGICATHGPDTSSRICEDAAVAPGMAQAAESAPRMDRKGRTCADYGKRLCKKRKWCRFDRDSQTCEEKEAGYLRG